MPPTIATIPHLALELRLVPTETGGGAGGGKPFGLGPNPIGTPTCGDIEPASAVVAVTPAPHERQNEVPPGTAVPHDPQKRGVSASGTAGRAVPQLKQNAASSGMRSPHEEQFTGRLHPHLGPIKTRTVPPKPRPQRGLGAA